jgi:hypothetical protein
VSYFDHVRCSACKAMLDPESLGSRPGQGLSCPRCGAPLSLGDLFGLKDAFAEEEPEDLSLDDALSRMKDPTASVRPPEPPRSRAAAPRPAARPAAPAPKSAAAPRAGPASARPAAPNQLPGPGAPASPPRPVPARPAAATPAPPPPAEGEASGALDAMRALRKKK